MKKISIFCMSGWGELGNKLTATNLMNKIKSIDSSHQVNLYCANEFFEMFEDVGRDIKKAALTSISPDDLYDQYSFIMKTYDRIYLDILGDKNNFLKMMNKFINIIQSTKPDIIFCTKGVIARVCVDICSIVGLSPFILNYVSNHQHFQFKIHHTSGVNLHLVRTKEGYDYFMNNFKDQEEKIRFLGYIVAHNLNHLTEHSTISRVLKPNLITAIIVSNRGGVSYYNLIESLLVLADKINLIYITINDEVISNKVQNLVDKYNIKNWQVINKLSQDKYYSLLANANKISNQILITKASPNSIYEAIYLNIPMILHRSGLPMEDWSCSLVEKNFLGIVHKNMDELKKNIINNLSNHEMLNFAKNKGLVYKNALPSQEEISSELGDIISLLDSGF